MIKQVREKKVHQIFLVCWPFDGKAVETVMLVNI